MSDIHLQFHNTCNIRTQAVEINGRWHRKIKFEAGGISTTIVLYCDAEHGTVLTEQPNEYVRVSNTDARVELSGSPLVEASQ